MTTKENTSRQIVARIGTLEDMGARFTKAWKDAERGGERLSGAGVIRQGGGEADGGIRWIERADLERGSGCLLHGAGDAFEINRQPGDDEVERAARQGVFVVRR